MICHYCLAHSSKITCPECAARIERFLTLTSRVYNYQMPKPIRIPNIETLSRPKPPKQKKVRKPYTKSSRMISYDAAPPLLPGDAMKAGAAEISKHN